MDDNLTIRVYDTNGNEIIDPVLLRASRVRKGSQYPGGLYGSAEFILPRDILHRPTSIQGGFVVRIWDGGNLIYDGRIESLEDVSTRGQQATRVGCVGPWGYIMSRLGIERNWADTRLDGGTWYRQTSATGAELATDERDDDRIRVTPKGVAWALNDAFAILYDMPTGETIGRVTNDFDFQEAAQVWTWRLRDTVGATDIWTKNGSGSGSEANSLGTPRQSLSLQLVSGAGQTPTEGGTYYGEISNVVMYASRNHASATLGTVNAYEIALDILDLLGVDQNLISAGAEDLDSTLTVSLVPFITNGFETFAAILSRAAGFGNSALGSIGFGLRSPFLAADNLPRLFLETYPALTDYDYETSVEESGVRVRLNVDDVYNWIVVEYTDLLGNTVTLTPDDNSALTDATSVATYGKRIPPRLVLPLANATTAAAFGSRFLARHKDPTYAVTQPVQVTRLRVKNGGFVPASVIDAGKRLRIVDLPNVTGQASPGGVTFLITRTEYTHDSRTATLSLGGAPDSLDVLLAQMSLGG